MWRSAADHVLVDHHHVTKKSAKENTDAKTAEAADEFSALWS